jgi:hypothetical protein
MRSALLRTAPALLAVLLAAGCDPTLPWTEEDAAPATHGTGTCTDPPVTAPFVAAPSSLSFRITAGGADPAPQTFTLSLSGGQTSPFYSCIATNDAPISWISWTPTKGCALPVVVQVTMHGAGIPAGSTRTGTLLFQTVPCSQYASFVGRVPVTFTVE